jgi:CheY-like chemotaxis protein
VSAIVRLRDMGIDSFKIASVLKGVLAQRLVRRVCLRCAEPMDEADIPAEVRPPEGYAGTFKPVRSVGCKACNSTGYKGRIAVLELLPIESPVARLIEADAAASKIMEASRPFGMTTLWESGLQRFWEGVTSLDEIRRVLGEAHERESAGVAAEAAEVAARPVASTAIRPGGTSAEDGSGATILLADDDAQMRRLVRTVLEREGFLVVEASDGLDTLEAIDTRPIDLVLLDHDMPRLTGLGVLEELRAQVSTAGLPVIMLTARTDDTESHALELGAQDYLTKPVQPRSLVARVKAVLKRTRME